MRRATWYLPTQTLPSRSGVGKRMNIMGAIVYWREMDADLGKFALRCEVLRDVLHMWDGSTKDQEKGERKAQPTAEPNDYVRTAPTSSPLRCTYLLVPIQHGNVDHNLFNKYCIEINKLMNEKFPAPAFPPCLFIIDGAKSHKKQLLETVTKTKSNMAKMREYLRLHSQFAPPEHLWNEDAKSPFHKKKDGEPKTLSKPELWAICESVKANVKILYHATEIFRWGRTTCWGVQPGHTVVFTPPYHPELQ